MTILMSLLFVAQAFAGGGGIGEHVGAYNFGYCESKNQMLSFEMSTDCYDEGTGEYCFNTVSASYNSQEYVFDAVDSVMVFDSKKRTAVFSSKEHGRVGNYLVEMSVSLLRGGYIEIKSDDGKIVVPKTKVDCAK